MPRRADSRAPIRGVRLRVPPRPDGTPAGAAGAYVSVALPPAVEVASPRTRSRANGVPVGIELLSTVAMGQQAPAAAAAAAEAPRRRDRGRRLLANGVGAWAGGAAEEGGGGDAPADAGSDPLAQHGDGIDGDDGSGGSDGGDDADAADGSGAMWGPLNSSAMRAKMLAADEAYAQQLAAQDGASSPWRATRRRAKQGTLAAGGAALGGGGTDGDGLPSPPPGGQTSPAAGSPLPGGARAAKRRRAKRVAVPVADEDYSGGSADDDSGGNSDGSGTDSDDHDGDASVEFRAGDITLPGTRRILPRRARSAGRRACSEGGHEDANATTPRAVVCGAAASAGSQAGLLRGGPQPWAAVQRE